MDGVGVAFVGVPLDSAGADEGEVRAVHALRRAGVVELAGARDAGDVEAAMTTTTRDPKTGIIAVQDLRRITAKVRGRVSELLRGGELPLVVGGDDSYLPGMLAGARDRVGRLGLAFVDGHLDATDGSSSPTGEAADMGLAIATGHGDPTFDAWLGQRPLVAPADVVALGSRLEEPWCRMPDGSLGREADLVDPAVRVLRASEIQTAGAAETGLRVEHDLAAAGPLWLHVDVDVLDEVAMPAVSYPQPDGLTWEQLLELVTPLAGSPRLIGMDVACYNPDLDPGGRYAHQVAALIEAMVGALAAARVRPSA